MVIAMVKGLFPFGGQSIYYGDLANEYSVFLTELWRKVHTGGSLFYSWKTGLGGNFWGNIFYDTSSPFNLLVLLVKENHIDEMITILIYLRQALAASFMCWFLCRRKGGRPSFFGVLCGFLYAFCGWFCGYYYVIIWLDVFMLMPLLLLGIERIVDFYSHGLYFAVFSVILFSSFYMAYYAAVFAVVYWICYYFANYRLFDPKGKDGRTQKIPFLKSHFFFAGATFAAASVLSVLCLSVLLLPLLLLLFRTGANEDTFSVAAFFTNLTQHISAMFSGASFKTSTFPHYPAVYTGVVAFAAVPLYFFLKDVTKRKKIMVGVLMVLMVLSFHLPLLDYVWHGFRYPTNNPFREALFFSIVLILIIYRVLTSIREIPLKALFISVGAAAVIGFSGAVELINRAEKDLSVSIGDVAVTVVLLLLIVGMLALLRFGKKEQIAVATVFLFLFCFGDGVYTFLSNVQRMEGFVSPEAKKEEMDDLLGRIDDEQLFYRTELISPWIINDGAFFDYAGVRQSSSTAPVSTLKLLNDFGCDSNQANFAGYEMQTPMFNSVFGVKYLIEPKEYADFASMSYLSCSRESYRVVETVGDYSLYQFDNALSIGFAADSELAEWKTSDGEAEANQASFYAAAAGADDSVLIYCDAEAEATAVSDKTTVKELGAHQYYVEKTALDDESAYGVALKVKAQTSGFLYVCAEAAGDSFSNITLWTVNGEVGNRPVFSTVSSAICRAVYDAKKDEELTVCVSPVADTPCTLRIRVFQIDSAVFARQHESIEKNGQLELKEFSDTHFKGTVDVTGENRVLCVTVPYDPGWAVKIDGETLSEDAFSLIDGVLYCIPLQEGNHTVVFDYHLPGLSIGIVVSCCSVLITAAFFLFARKKRLLPRKGFSQRVEP